MKFGPEGFSLTFEIPQFKDLPVWPGRSAFHYTGFDALLGMIENGEMWATNVAFLNDYSEVQHGIDLLRSTWEKLRPEIDVSARNKVDELLAIGTSMYGLERFFVISASSEDEDAAQFERYGPYSVELDTRVPLYSEANRPGFPDDMKLLSLYPAWREVVYESEEKSLRCNALLEKLVTMAREKSDWSPAHNELLTHWFSWWIANVVVSLKDRAFRAEHEVRFVMLTEAKFDEIHTRSSRYSEETPFVKLSDITDSNPGSLPIRGITVNPQYNSSGELKMLRDALAEASIDVTIRVSEIPLR